MRPRLTLWIALVGTLFTLQLGWWGYLLWQQHGLIRTAALDGLQLRRQMAETAWRARLDQGAGPAEAWRAIGEDHPSVSYLPGPDGGSTQIKPSAVEDVEAGAAGRERMILGEGALFLLLTVLGLALYLRVARRESFLVLQQSNFLHSVTHELRSPLQSLRLAVESFIRRPEPSRARAYADGMLEDIARLEALVENLLAVGRLEAEAFRAVPARIDLSAAIETQVQRYLGFAGKGEGDLNVRIEAGVQAEADPTTLEPILRNLLDNAFKYGDGAPVGVTLSREPPYARLEVMDSGRGFTHEERRHLFERFWRAGDERVRTAPGTGLGLFLVATLLRAQGATVDARSEGMGRGARFIVRWPLAVVED